VLGLSEFGVNPEGEKTYTINPQNVDTVQIRTHTTLNTTQGFAHKQDNKYKVATHDVTYVLMTQTNSRQSAYSATCSADYDNE
jgi:hypothetical protein